MYRVQKLLSNYGFCSRRKAEELIKAGKVKINNKVISIGDKAEESDKIYVDNKLVSPEKKVYIMFNKPLGCVTALTDPQYKTVMDFVKIKERIFPVGRLDYNTSGLLLLTNDGDFANNITHPSKETNKTYKVMINKPITNREISLIEDGLKIEGKKTAKSIIKKLGPALLEITIHEGRNRIVRKMFHKLDFTVVSLERIKVGNLELGDLKPGKYKELTKEERDMIFS